jgi:undecaprenyl diphosphate synthase
MTPKHVAVIMDGNRRWAKNLGLTVALGHANGVRRVRGIVQACAERGIPFLTLFAFSTENWARPEGEVSNLMSLFALYLQKEIKDLNAKGVRLKVVGDTSKFATRIQNLIRDAEANTAHNTVITLTVAANYGGRWDLLQAARAWQAANLGKSVNDMDETGLASHLALAYAPDPDLLIRTGGESRISNFMLWQQAYTELFFTDLLWPDFNAEELDRAINWYTLRDRRFGGSSTIQLAVENGPAVA